MNPHRRVERSPHCTHTLHVQTSTQGAPSHKILTGFEGKRQTGKSEEKIDCHHQDGETDVEDPRSFATLSPPNQLVASPRWAQQYEVVVATSAIICKKGFAPHTGARAIPTSYCCAQRRLATSWFGGDSVANDRGSSTSVSPSRSDTDSRCYLVFTRCFVALETERLCKFVSLMMFVPGEHYISGALQAQSSSAYSSSTYEG